MSSNLNLKKLCAFCGREFVAHKTSTTCCSHRCSSLLYKQRKREAKTKAHDAMTDFLISEKPLEKIKSKPFLTISETALYLGVSRPTIYSYLRNGELKAKRMGCIFKICRDDIDNLFRNPEAFAITAKEKQPITEFYTTKEVLDNSVSVIHGCSRLRKKTTFRKLPNGAKHSGVNRTSTDSLPSQPRRKKLPNGTRQQRYRSVMA